MSGRTTSLSDASRSPLLIADAPECAAPRRSPRRGDARRQSSHMTSAGPRGAVDRGERPAAGRAAMTEPKGQSDGLRRTKGRVTMHATIAKSRYDAVIFDLDGVVTQTAAVHAAAWKRLFDAYLAERAARAGTSPGGRRPTGGAPALRPRGRLPRCYVDGKPRYDGVRDFLASRGIELPVGDPSDPPERGDGLRARQPQERLLQRRGRGARRQDLPVHRRAHPRSCATRGSGSASCRRARTPPWCST